MTWSSLLKALALVGMMLGVVMGPYWLGVRNGSATEKALCSDEATLDQHKAITALQTELQLAWDQLKQQQRQHAADAAAQRELEQQLDIARANTRVIYRTLRKEIPHASFDITPVAPVVFTQRAPADAGVVGSGGCRFGPDFVGLWDAASDPARAAASGAGLPDAASLASAPTGDADPAQAVSVEQLLANHVDNAELGTEARDQLNALIDWHFNHDLPGGAR